jgi:hypothetical protein
MAKVIDKQKAINLRKQGKTYGQIKNALNISKSTLSDWLSKYPLNKEQLSSLGENRKYSRQVAIEKTTFTKQKKRQSRIQAAYEEQKKYWVSLSQKELEIAGLFLYWGEGSKRLNGSVFINNTDPNVLKFALYWYVKGLRIPKEKIKVDLHLYSDMNIQEEISFWSRTLKLPVSQFRKPYIKVSTRVGIDQKGFGHGTCGLNVNNVLLKEKIMMGIKTISDYYALRLEAMI